MKSQVVRLDRMTALELVCRVFQAERAVTGLSELHWPELIRYYTPARVTELQGFIERMRELLPVEVAGLEDASPPPCLRPDFRLSWWYHLLLALGGPLLVYCWPLLNRRRSGWSFPCRDLAYALNRLEAFLHLLRRPFMPTYEAIVSLRMELHACRWLIEGRCEGVPELKKLALLDYFNKSPYVETTPLSTFIQPAVPSAA